MAETALFVIEEYSMRHKESFPFSEQNLKREKRAGAKYIETIIPTIVSQNRNRYRNNIRATQAPNYNRRRTNTVEIEEIVEEDDQTDQ